MKSPWYTATKGYQLFFERILCRLMHGWGTSLLVNHYNIPYWSIVIVGRWYFYFIDCPLFSLCRYWLIYIAPVRYSFDHIVQRGL